MIRTALLTMILLSASWGAIPAATGSTETPDLGPRLRIPDLYRVSALERNSWLFSPSPRDEEGEDRDSPGAFSFATHYRALFGDPLYGPKKVRLSRFDCALKGAGGGAKLGLILGALATTFGERNDKTALYLMGAGAAAGALMGGTIGAEDSRFNIRYDWSIAPSEENR